MPSGADATAMCYLARVERPRRGRLCLLEGVYWVCYWLLPEDYWRTSPRPVSLSAGIHTAIAAAPLGNVLLPPRASGALWGRVDVGLTCRDAACRVSEGLMRITLLSSRYAARRVPTARCVFLEKDFRFCEIFLLKFVI